MCVPHLTARSLHPEFSIAECMMPNILKISWRKIISLSHADICIKTTAQSFHFDCKELLFYQEIIKNTCTLGRPFIQAHLPTQAQVNSNITSHPYINNLQISDYENRRSFLLSDFELRSPWGVHWTHQAYKPCFIIQIPSQTCWNVCWSSP